MILLMLDKTKVRKTISLKINMHGKVLVHIVQLDASSCENEERCEKCSESHKGGCKGKIKCYNCKGSHGAGVRDCPVYVNLFERLTSRQ